MPLWYIAARTSSAPTRRPRSARSTSSSTAPRSMPRAFASAARTTRRQHAQRQKSCDRLRSSRGRGDHARVPDRLRAPAIGERRDRAERGHHQLSARSADHLRPRASPARCSRAAAVARLERRRGGRHEAGAPDTTVVALTGDGSYMFSMPSTVHWMARRYAHAIPAGRLQQWRLESAALLDARGSSAGAGKPHRGSRHQLRPTAGLRRHRRGGGRRACGNRAPSRKRLRPRSSARCARCERNAAVPWSMPGCHADGLSSLRWWTVHHLDDL